MIRNIGKSTEPTITHEIGSIMRKNGDGSNWVVYVERTQVLKDKKDESRPDIILHVTRPSMSFWLAVEIKFDNTTNEEKLEKKARESLGKILINDKKISIVVAILVPEYLRNVDQRYLRDKILKCIGIRFKFYHNMDSLNRSKLNKEWEPGGLDLLMAKIDLGANLQ